MELKNPADENATIWNAFNQIQTYKAQIPSLFTYNELLIISDGLEARVGSLTADTERFMPWRTIEGEELAPASMPQLQVVIAGTAGQAPAAGLHPLLRRLRGRGRRRSHEEDCRLPPVPRREPRAGRDARRLLLRRGDRRVGVVWHTQGSGKSLTMAFYAGRLVLEPRLQNPTIVMLTDRNDLDDQLYGTFSRCHELLRQAPVQAADREHLRSLLQVSSGGVVFTTIQKFMPPRR